MKTRFIARAPVSLVEGDRRPGDCFEADPKDVAAQLERGDIEPIGGQADTPPAKKAVAAGSDTPAATGAGTAGASVTKPTTSKKAPAKKPATKKTATKPGK